MAALPTSMQAWTHTVRGSPPTVLKLSTIPLPTCKTPTDVLIKVAYGALNPGGAVMMHHAPFIFRKSPGIPEMDFAGTVVSSGTGDSTSIFEPGTEVFGSIKVAAHLGGGQGSLSEYLVVDSSGIVKKPENASVEEVSGLGVAGCTALILVEKARLRNGHRVLINGSSGGIGTLVVQMVKDIVGKDGEIVGICSSKNVEISKQLGADKVIAYDEHKPVHEYLSKEYSVSKFDVIIDAVGIQEIWQYCPDYLVESGPFVTVGVAFHTYDLSSVLYATYLMMIKNDLVPVLFGGVPRKYVRVTSLVDAGGLEKLRGMVEAGKLKGVVDSTWPLEEALLAYGRLISKRARGKVVVRMPSVEAMELPG